MRYIITLLIISLICVAGFKYKDDLLLRIKQVAKKQDIVLHQVDQSDNISQEIIHQPNVLAESDKQNDEQQLNEDGKEKIQGKVVPSPVQNISCKDCFMALDQVIIKFFLKESFAKEIKFLQSVVKTYKIHQQLQDLLDQFDQHKEDVFDNQLINQIISIKKIPDRLIDKKDFINAINNLQQYFYSSEFIKSCYEN